MIEKLSRLGPALFFSSESSRAKSTLKKILMAIFDFYK